MQCAFIYYLHIRFVNWIQCRWWLVIWWLVNFTTIVFHFWWISISLTTTSASSAQCLTNVHFIKLQFNANNSRRHSFKDIISYLYLPVGPFKSNLLLLLLCWLWLLIGMLGEILQINLKSFFYFIHIFCCLCLFFK